MRFAVFAYICASAIMKQILSSKIVLVLLAALSLFFGNLKYQQYRQQQAIEKEKQSLTSQEQQLTKNNQQLSDSLTYLTSDDFKQRVARVQLNMKKDGEVVYNFTDAPAEQNPQTGAAATGSSNPQKWWNYFFKN